MVVVHIALSTRDLEVFYVESKARLLYISDDAGGVGDRML